MKDKNPGKRCPPWRFFIESNPYLSKERKPRNLRTVRPIGKTGFQSSISRLPLVRTESLYVSNILIKITLIWNSFKQHMFNIDIGWVRALKIQIVLDSCRIRFRISNHKPTHKKVPLKGIYPAILLIFQFTAKKFYKKYFILKSDILLWAAAKTITSGKIIRISF